MIIIFWPLINLILHICLSATFHVLAIRIKTANNAQFWAAKEENLRVDTKARVKLKVQLFTYLPVLRRHPLSYLSAGFIKGGGECRGASITSSVFQAVGGFIWRCHVGTCSSSNSTPLVYSRHVAIAQGHSCFFVFSKKQEGEKKRLRSWYWIVVYLSRFETGVLFSSGQAWSTRREMFRKRKGTLLSALWLKA